jgi:hypothetical protein
MELEGEALFEESLEHEGEVVAGHVLGGGGNVVGVGAEPAGAAEDAVGLDLVGDVHQLANGHVVGFEAAGADVDVAEVACAGCAAADGGYFDLRAEHWSLSLGGARNDGCEGQDRGEYRALETYHLRICIGTRHSSDSIHALQQNSSLEG